MSAGCRPFVLGIDKYDRFDGIPRRLTRYDRDIRLVKSLSCFVRLAQAGLLRVYSRVRSGSQLGRGYSWRPVERSLALPHTVEGEPLSLAEYRFKVNARRVTLWSSLWSRRLGALYLRYWTQLQPESS